MAGLLGAHGRPENTVRSPRHPGRLLAPAHTGASWPRPAPRPHSLTEAHGGH